MVRFAAPPWNVQAAPWLQIDTQLSHDHLAREMRQAMTPLDVTELYDSYAGRGKAPHRPDLMLALVLFAWRRGQRQPRQWLQDPQENCALWWLGFGIQPSRRCWSECRARLGPSLDTCHAQVLPQAIDAEVRGVKRGAWDGSAVAAHAARRRLSNAERLHRRLAQLTAARPTEAPGHTPDDGPGWLAQTSHTRPAQDTRYSQAPDHRARLQAAQQRRSPSERRPPDKIVVSTGDPAAARGVDKAHVFRPLYTMQTVRDVDAPLLLSDAVCAQATAAGTFPPMLARTQQLTGRR
jgi:hypothetical protein